MSLLATLAALLALIFFAIGTAKILALAPMRALAAKAGFAIAHYRIIGVLEVASAVGVALGPQVPLLGGLAAGGLLLLLAGALVTHVRNGDEARDYAPAVVCAVLAGAYLAVLIGATS